MTGRMYASSGKSPRGCTRTLLFLFDLFNRVSRYSSKLRFHVEYPVGGVRVGMGCWVSGRMQRPSYPLSDNYEHVAVGDNYGQVKIVEEEYHDTTQNSEDIGKIRDAEEHLWSISVPEK